MPNKKISNINFIPPFIKVKANTSNNNNIKDPGWSIDSKPIVIKSATVKKGGKRKTRKNKRMKRTQKKNKIKNKKSSRKTSKKNYLYKKRIQRGYGPTFSRRRVYNHDFFYNKYPLGERLTIKTDDKESHSGKITNINQNNLVIEESDGISTIPYDQIIDIELDMYKK